MQLKRILESRPRLACLFGKFMIKINDSAIPCVPH